MNSTFFPAPTVSRARREKARGTAPESAHNNLSEKRGRIRTPSTMSSHISLRSVARDNDRISGNIAAWRVTVSDLVQKQLRDHPIRRNPRSGHSPPSSSSSTDSSGGNFAQPRFPNVESISCSIRSLTEARTRLKSNSAPREVLRSLKDPKLSGNQSRIRVQVIQDLRSLIACERKALDTVELEISRYERSLALNEPGKTPMATECTNESRSQIKLAEPCTLLFPDLQNPSSPGELFDDAVSEASVSDVRPSLFDPKMSVRTTSYPHQSLMRRG
jgi:hypothetical protein